MASPLVLSAAGMRNTAATTDAGDLAWLGDNTKRKALIDTCQAIIAARHAIGRRLDPALFADPARNILLDLLLQNLRGADVSVSSCCIAAGVPATTALRWIKVLEDRTLVVKQADPADARRMHVRLTPQGLSAMAAYVMEILASHAQAIVGRID